ncbi:MAG: chromosomal replication initiator protein DnaA [Phycisphaerales bacterium]
MHMSGPDPKIKDKLIGYLRKHHADICRQWFDFIEPVEVRDGTLVLFVPEGVQLRFLQKFCTEQFREAAQAATEMLVSVEFVGEEGLGAGSGGTDESIPALDVDLGADDPAGAADPNAPPAPVTTNGTAAPATPAIAPAARAPRDEGSGASASSDYDVVLSPDYSFDSFIVGPDNRLPHAASIAVSRMPGKAYNPLFLHGGVGLGKTHLLQAICHASLSARPETRIAYLSCEDFTTEFMTAVQGGEMSSFRHKFRNVDILVVDDIHDLAQREQTQEEFFHTFNTLFQHGRQIVLSSDAPPKEIPDLEERLTSRFNCGLVARLDRPCYETRVEIVKSKARLRGISIPEDVANYIGARYDANIRELEGAIARVQGTAAMDDTPITLSLARTALGDRDDGTSASQPNVQIIIETVAKYYDLKLPDLLSRRKQKSIAVPRQIGMYLARQHTRYSLEEIGGYFGGRDHTTVMHAVRKIEAEQSKDATLAEDVRRLQEQLTI